MKNKIDFLEILIWIITLIFSVIFLSLAYYFINEIDYAENYLFSFAILCIFMLFKEANKMLKRRRKLKLKIANDSELQEYINIYKNMCKEKDKKGIVDKFINSVLGLTYYYYDAEEKDEIKQEYLNANFNEDITSGIKKVVLKEYLIYDCIRGVINNINVEFIDLIEQMAIRGASSTHIKYFYGNFLIINKELNCNIKIHAVNNLYYGGTSNINVDNLEFNKYFKITAENEEDIQQYLTPSLIQFIADFREKYGIDFEIVFKGKIYIRFFTEDTFAPKNSGKIVDEHSVYKFYVITKFAKELVERLDAM